MRLSASTLKKVRRINATESQLLCSAMRMGRLHPHAPYLVGLKAWYVTPVHTIFDHGIFFPENIDGEDEKYCASAPVLPKELPAEPPTAPEWLSDVARSWTGSCLWL